MINNPLEEAGHAPGFRDLVEQGIAEGVIGGIVGFMTHNQINLKPSRSTMEPLTVFTGKLLSEYTSDTKDYPFKDSFKDFIVLKTEEHIADLKKVYENNEMINLRGMCHMIGGEAVAAFLEKNRIETIGIIAKIRGE